MIKAALGGVLLLTLCLAPARQVRGDDLEVRGHLKYQATGVSYAHDDLHSLLGPDDFLTQQHDFRLNLEKRASGYEFIAHAELLGIGGKGLDTQRQLLDTVNFSGSSSVLPSDRRRLLDMTVEAVDTDDYVGEARIDRLSAAAISDGGVLRLGRQAITWGNGLVFHALDLFNPFSPVAIDKDYKTGDDMLYGQVLFASGDDLQVLAIPRRELESRDLEADESSFALKFRGTSECFESDYDVVYARHFDQNVLGLGVNRSILEAVWRADLSLTHLDDGEDSVSFVTNIDRAFEVLGKNVYAYIEYFYSGVGVTDTSDIFGDTELQERLERGELFTVGRDYAAIGARVEWTPLLNMYPLEIVNVHDSSGFSQLRFLYDWSNDVQLQSGVNIPHGGNGSEFGGISVPGEVEAFLSAGQSVYVRMTLHF